MLATETPLGTFIREIFLQLVPLEKLESLQHASEAGLEAPCDEAEADWADSNFIYPWVSIIIHKLLSALAIPAFGGDHVHDVRFFLFFGPPRSD